MKMNNFLGRLDSIQIYCNSNVFFWKFLVFLKPSLSP